MGGDFAFTAASDIMNVSCRHEEDQAHVRAERGKAKDAEYQAHMRNGTWELTPLPKGERCISSGWVETDKPDQNGVIVRRKARFIAKGYSQKFGYDYLHTYAPVASMTTIRLILALTCILDLDLDNMDVETAYLQSDLEEKVYVKQPLGYEQYGPSGEEQFVGYVSRCTDLNNLDVIGTRRLMDGSEGMVSTLLLRIHAYIRSLDLVVKY
jgi:hypothetical protein